MLGIKKSNKEDSYIESRSIERNEWEEEIPNKWVNGEQISHLEIIIKQAWTSLVNCT